MEVRHPLGWWRTSVHVSAYAKLKREGYHGLVWTVWVEVDMPPHGDAEHIIYVIGTGHPIPDDAGSHLLTLEYESFVWHLYPKVS